MNERYTRNIGAVTQSEQELLWAKKAVVIGCGGLGCYAAEFLARLGLGNLTLIDGDVFAESNLNRQLYSLETNLGKPKAAEAKNRLLQVRSNMYIEVFEKYLNEENAGELLKGHDIIIDALDNVKTRLLVEKTACSLGIPIVHGAVEGWCAQICTVFPGDFILSALFSNSREYKNPSVLAFTPAFCASIQAAEAVKVLLGRKNILRMKLLTVNLMENTFDIIELEHNSF